jgi:hypothetical protein
MYCLRRHTRRRIWLRVGLSVRHEPIVWYGPHVVADVDLLDVGAVREPHDFAAQF